jgi:hypothetical protein
MQLIEQRLTRHEVMHDIVGTTKEGLKSLMRRQHVALAFGIADAPASIWYTPCDAVSMLIAMQLAKSYGAATAARLTRAFADTVLTAIAQAEGDFAQDVLFCIIDLVHEVDGKRGYLACGALNAAPESIAAELATLAKDGYAIEQIISVNVSRIIRQVRVTAAGQGLDLTGRFLPRPESDEFKQLLEPFAAVPAGIVELRSLKNRDAVVRRVGAQARARAMAGRTNTGLRKQPTTCALSAAAS